MGNEVSTEIVAGMDSLPAIIESREKLPTLSAQVGALVISTPDDKSVALDLSHHIDEEIKAIEAGRVRLVKPLNDHVKMINADAKAEAAPWQSLQGVVKTKVDDYAFAERERVRKENERQMALAAKRDAAERERLAKMAAEAESRGIDPEFFIPPVPAPIIPQVQAAAPTTRLETGSVTERFEWTVELIPGGENTVPREFCSPDLVKLRAAVRFGTRSIPGARIFERRVETHRGR